MLWAIRSLLGTALALEVGFLVASYNADGHGFGFWYLATLTVCFIILLFSGALTWARVLRVIVGAIVGVSALNPIHACSRFGTMGAACNQVLGPLDYRRDLLAVWSTHAQLSPDAVLAFEAVLAVGLVIGFGGEGFAFIAGAFFLAATTATIAVRGLEVALASGAPLLCAGSFMLSAILTTRGASGKAKRDDPVMLAFDEAQQKERNWGGRYRERLEANGTK
jgi:hypothetical protein